MKKHLILALFALVSVLKVSAQTPPDGSQDTTLQVIITHNNVEYIGLLIEKNPHEILIKQQNGDLLYIPSYEVKTITPLSEHNFKKGEFISGNPHPSRYFYTPSAIPIKRGDGYIQTIYGGVWQFQYGLTDRFSLGIGTPIIGAPIWITPKWSFKLGENVWGALGAQAGSFGWLMEGKWDAVFGIGYGVITFGNEQQNLSIGAGYLGTRLPQSEFIIADSSNWTGYDREYVETNGGFAFSLGGMKRVQKNMLVIGELWALPSITDDVSLTFGGPGLRLMRQQNVWDFGFWVFSINDDGDRTTFPVPYISFTWKLL
ncbi:MAG: hypothetical protein KDC92_13690 [Bacteroidetes bacterium]|nr:hypothetical protein [Bacteroidota bacterium]